MPFLGTEFFSEYLTRISTDPALRDRAAAELQNNPAAREALADAINYDLARVMATGSPKRRDVFRALRDQYSIALQRLGVERLENDNASVGRDSGSGPGNAILLPDSFGFSISSPVDSTVTSLYWRRLHEVNPKPDLSEFSTARHFFETTRWLWKMRLTAEARFQMADTNFRDGFNRALRPEPELSLNDVWRVSSRSGLRADVLDAAYQAVRTQADQSGVQEGRMPVAELVDFLDTCATNVAADDELTAGLIRDVAVHVPEIAASASRDPITQLLYL